MNLKDRIKEIQQEYKQYAYVSHPPKKSEKPTEYEQMMQQIYDRKKILSDILKAYKGKTLERDGDDLERRLNDSDAYFSSITAESKNHHNRFFDGVDVKVKDTPEFQSYHMIYMNLMNSVQLQKTHSAVSQALTKAKEKQKEASDNRDILKVECSKEVMDSMMNISKEIIESEENIVDINRQRRELEKTTSEQLQDYNKQKEELNKKLEKPRENLKIFDIRDKNHKFNEDYENYLNRIKTHEEYMGCIKEYTRVYNAHDKLYKRNENYQLNRASYEMKLVEYCKGRMALKFKDNVDLSKLKGFEFEDTSVKLGEFLDDYSFDYDQRDRIMDFFTYLHPTSPEKYYEMTVAEMLNLVEKFEKDRDELFGQELKDFDDLESLIRDTIVVGGHWTWEQIEERVVRFGLLPDGLTLEEARNQDKDNYFRDIRDIAITKRDELKNRIDEKCKKLEENLPVADKYYIADKEEMEQLSTQKEELLNQLRGLWKIPTGEELPSTLSKYGSDMLRKNKSVEEYIKDKLPDYLYSFLSRDEVRNNTGKYFTYSEIQKIESSDFEYAMKWLNSKMDTIKAEMAESENQLAEIDANIETIQNNKEQKLSELAEAESKNHARIQSKPKDAAQLVNGEKLENAAAAFVKANAEVMKTTKEASDAAQVKMSQDFKEFKAEAENWLKIAELHHKGHDNSTEFDAMITAVGKFIETKDDSPEMKSVIEEMQATSQKYLEEKHKQRRPFATDRRKTRLTLGESIKFYSENALKTYEVVNELDSVGAQAEHKQVEIEATNEIKHEVEQPEIDDMEM